MGYLNRINFNFINKIYFTPKDLIDGCYNLLYKKEVDKLNQEFDEKNEDRKFLIDEDGNVSLNPVKVEQLLQKNIEILNKIRDQKIDDNPLEKSLNVINNIYLNSSIADREAINSKIKEIIRNNQNHQHN